MKEEYYDKRRWYDRDPLLSKSMRTLEETDDETQIKVALNLIKIIIEHNIASNEFEAVGDILSAVEEGVEGRGNARWYDIDKTVRTAITMLENSSEHIQAIAAKEIAKMVVDKIKENKDVLSPSFKESNKVSAKVSKEKSCSPFIMETIHSFRLPLDKFNLRFAKNCSISESISELRLSSTSFLRSFSIFSFA